jgi:tetratricopeptide (TPR) repeat protein
MLHEACQQDSADQQLWHHLGLLLLGKHSAAGYQAADGTTPDPLAQTQNHLANNNLDQALAWACLARAHADGLGALALGHVHLARDEPDDAGEALAHAAATVPTDQLSEILAAYDQLLAAQPDHPWRHAEYADALHRAGRTRDAATAYDHAVLLAPEDPSLRFNRAHFLFGLGRLTDAAADLLEVTRLRPHDVLGAQVLLAAIAWPNDNSAAVEHFEAALASPGERLTPFTRAYYRALALAGRGRIREATTELETAQPARTSDEFTLDATDAILLDRLRNPPLPGLDMLRELLQAVPETGMRSTSG